MLDAALEARHRVGGPRGGVGVGAVRAVPEPLGHGVRVCAVDGAPRQPGLAVTGGLGGGAGGRGV